MATLSSRNGIPLATRLVWYKIRDTFFGDNDVFQSIHLALELASPCDHADALWLTEACARKDVTTREDAKRVFSALCENDARALCFTWLLGDREDFTPLRRSAELGFAFAQASFAGRTDGEEKFKFARLAAAQGERDGFYWLGWCFCHGEGCEMDLDKAKENYLVAGELGDVSAMLELGWLLDACSAQRWCWWGRAAARAYSYNFLSYFPKQVDLFNSGAKDAVVMFVIGRALQGHVNEEARTMFRDSFMFDACISPAKQAIAFYEAQIKATKAAMLAWTLVGIKLNVVKDVRKVIAKLIWDVREEALYKDMSSDD
jgi:hypothetical protein